MYNFQDRVAIVTGASSGIGEAAARLLAKEGARVVLAARRMQELERVAADLPRSACLRLDVTEEGSARNLAEETLARFGRIDILVNNAGVLVYKPMLETSPQEVRRVMEVNFFGAVACANAVIPAMRRQRSGAIVNVSSVAGRIAFSNLGYYSASKFAFTGFSEALRQELSPEGIRVITIAPGTVYTPMTSAIVDDAVRRGKSVLPISAQDVARAIVAAVREGKREVLVPWPTRAFRLLHFFFPDFAERLAYRFRASDAAG